MNIIGKIVITALLVMLTTGLVGLLGSITEKEKLCEIAGRAFFVEVFLFIVLAIIAVWI